MKKAREITLNLVDSKSNIIPSTSSPLEYGNNFYRPESIVSGGDAFQSYRNLLQYAYVKDALPVENGLTSVKIVEKEGFTVIGAGEKGAYVTTHCDKCEDLVIYPCDLWKSVNDIHDGTLILNDDGVQRVIGLNPVIYKKQAVNGILDADDQIIGMLSLRNMNLIYTKDEVYHNGTHTDTEPPKTHDQWFDYNPSLRTAAGDFSVLDYIGHIITLVAANDNFYIFGTHGAVLSTVCSEDPLYRFRLKRVEGHSGIRNKDDVISKDGLLTTLIVNSNEGLQSISGANAEFILEEESRQLNHGAITFFKNPCMQEDTCLCSGNAYPKKQTLSESEILADEFKDTIVSNKEAYVELFLDKKERQHLAVNNFNKFTVISFGTVTTVRCGEDCTCWTRMLVYNKALLRYTILHIEHTDVLRPHKNTDEILTIINGTKAYSLVEGGVGEVLYKEFLKTNQSAFTISKVQLHGRFDEKLLRKEQDKILEHFPAYLGNDLSSSMYVNNMQMVSYGSNNVIAHGRWRGNICTFLVPFTGTLNELKLFIV